MPCLNSTDRACPVSTARLNGKKKPQPIIRLGLLNKDRQRHTLPLGIAVPSAQVSLTSLFGMGRGGPHRYNHLKTIMTVIKRELELQ